MADSGIRIWKRCLTTLAITALIIACGLIAGCSDTSSDSPQGFPVKAPSSSSTESSHDQKTGSSSAVETSSSSTSRNEETIVTAAYTITIPEQWKNDYSYNLKEEDPESLSMSQGFAWHVEVIFDPWYGFEVAAITDDWTLQGNFNGINLGPSKSCPGWNVWIYSMGTIGDSSLEEYASWISTEGGDAQYSAKSPKNVDGYILPYSNAKIYPRDELEKLSTRDLFLARNEIYARHGRIFDSQELRDYFTEKSWYHGSIQPSDFSESILSYSERTNANTMLDIEQSRNSPYL